MKKRFLFFMLVPLFIACKKDDNEKDNLASGGKLIDNTWILEQSNVKTINTSTHAIMRDTTYYYNEVNGQTLTFLTDGTFSLLDKTVNPPFPERNYYQVQNDSVYMQTNRLQDNVFQYSTSSTKLVLKGGHTINATETASIITFHKL